MSTATCQITGNTGIQDISQFLPNFDATELQLVRVTMNAHTNNTSTGIHVNVNAA